MPDAKQDVKSPKTAPRIAVILAGGKSQRMGNADKAELPLGGVRLIDRTIERLSPQVDRVLIAGPKDYATGLTAIGDRRDGPIGPAAGLWSAMHWIEKHAPLADGFVTAPVDGPFAPKDLYARLAAAGSCAVASDANGLHPTFAYWRLKELKPALSASPAGRGAALHEIAKRCAADHIAFPDPYGLMNLNTPEDLVRAVEILGAGAAGL